MKILVASNNKAKLAELKRILGTDHEFVSLTEAGVVSDPEENGASFYENAKIKAESGMRASGLPCLADDSGLCVGALGDAPGIMSARYAGDPCDDAKNNELLLKNLEGKDRSARFVCHICLVFPDGSEINADGECAGRICEGLRGEGGFGYDPLFEVEGYGMTFAEISGELKNTVSHRARAIAKLKRKLDNINDK